MNTSLKTIVVAVALAAASHQAALAQDAGQARTRAQVVAELDAARASGQHGAYSGEDSGSFHLSNQAATASRSRAEVMNEMYAARASGETAAITGEDSGAAWLAQRSEPTQLPRFAVAAQVQQARAAGELGALHGEDSGSFWLATHGTGYSATAGSSPGQHRMPAQDDRQDMAANSR